MTLRALVLIAVLTVAPSMLAAAPSIPDTPRQLQAIEVRAAPAKPVLWKYTRGPVTLWVLGVVGPLPKGHAFDDAEIRQRVAESGAVLGAPGLVVGDNVGVLRMMTLWPAMRRLQFNPDGASLSSVLPAEMYGRWQRARSRYAGPGNHFDHLRPMYAAFRLYRAAMEASALTEQDAVDALLLGVAKRHRIPVVDARARLAVANARKAVKTFDVPHAADVACLDETIDRLDAWLPAAHAVADAWSVGDVMAARTARSPNPVRACWAHLTNDAVARGEGIEDLDAHVREAWRAALQKTTAAHAVVFATIPLRDAVDGTGYAALLAAEGFQAQPVAE